MLVKVGHTLVQRRTEVLLHGVDVISEDVVDCENQFGIPLNVYDGL